MVEDIPTYQLVPTGYQRGTNGAPTGYQRGTNPTGPSFLNGLFWEGISIWYVLVYNPTMAFLFLGQSNLKMEAVFRLFSFESGTDCHWLCRPLGPSEPTLGTTCWINPLIWLESVELRVADVLTLSVTKKSWFWHVETNQLMRWGWIDWIEESFQSIFPLSFNKFPSVDLENGLKNGKFLNIQINSNNSKTIFY